MDGDESIIMKEGAKGAYRKVRLGHLRRIFSLEEGDMHLDRGLVRQSKQYISQQGPYAVISLYQ